MKNRKTRTMCENCSKLTIKAPAQRYDFELWNRFHKLFCCFHCCFEQVNAGLEAPFRFNCKVNFPSKNAINMLDLLGHMRQIIQDWIGPSRPYPFKFFKGCLSQILLRPFLNTMPPFLHLSKIFYKFITGYKLPL